MAASKGNTEIVKILVPLTDNPNAPVNSGKTPYQVAQNEEICEILAKHFQKIQNKIFHKSTYKMK